jgi:hypothetical protein
MAGILVALAVICAANVRMAPPEGQPAVHASVSPTAPTTR